MVRCFDLEQNSFLEEQLISIWQESFGDSRAYISNFLNINAAHTKVVAYMEEDRIVSVVYLLPISYIGQDDVVTKCYYAYAGATLSACRGRGYFGSIWQFIKERISEPIILVPASESLVGYYKGQGFNVWLTERCIEVSQSAMKQDSYHANVTQLSAETYCNFRNQYLQKSGSMLWDEAMMSYICGEHQMFGGEFMQVEADGASLYVMCRKEKHTLHIVELLSAEASFPMEKHIQALMQKLSCNKASVCLQPWVMANQPFFEAEKGYFNLTMG